MTQQPRYNPLTGEIVHEPWAADGERLDVYLARRRPDKDAAAWYAECDADHIEVRDHFDPRAGSFTGRRWYLKWWNGAAWEVFDLDEGERPRMRDGFCHIVREDRPLYDCAECGHLHWTGAVYVECPIEGCDCEGQP